MEKAYADAKKDVERLQKQLLRTRQAVDESSGAGSGANNSTSRRLPRRRRQGGTGRGGKGRGAAQGFRRQAAEFEKKGDEARARRDRQNLLFSATNFYSRLR